MRKNINFHFGFPFLAIIIEWRKARSKMA